MRTFTFISAVAAMFVSAAVAGAQEWPWTPESIEARLKEAGIAESLPAVEKDVDCSVYIRKEGRKRPQQGMVIYGDFIFSGEDGGHVNIYSFSKADGKVTGGFELASSRPDNHVNNLEFGPSKARGSKFPLLYVSNGKVGSEIEWTCSVERIRKRKGVWSSELVQNITLNASEWESNGYTPIFGAPSWLIDKERGFLWVFSAVKRTVSKVTSDPADNRYVATRFRIPSLKEGREVTLGAEDILEQKVFPFDVWFTQAGCMPDGKIYYGFGIGNYDPKRPSCIRVYDTDRGVIEARYELKDEIIYEIEDIELKDGWLWVNCNNNPKRTKEKPFIYRLSLPKGR